MAVAAYNKIYFVEQNFHPFHSLNLLNVFLQRFAFVIEVPGRGLVTVS